MTPTPQKSPLDPLDFASKMGHAARIKKDKIVDDFCDEHGVSDELRAEFKKVSPINFTQASRR